MALPLLLILPLLSISPASALTADQSQVWQSLAPDPAPSLTALDGNCVSYCNPGTDPYGSPVDTRHTATVRVIGDNGDTAGVPVQFSVVSGPNAGVSGTS